MSNQISVSFKVAGGELASYMDSIQKKSQNLTNEAIQGAMAQAEAGKQQIAIINAQIAAIERKTRIETQAARSIALERRESDLKSNAEKFESRREKVFSDRNLTEEVKKEKIIALTGSEQEEAKRIKNEYRDNLTVLSEQERQAKLQTQLSREHIDTLKQTARENVRAIISGDKKLEDVISNAQTEDEKLVARLTQEEFEREKKKDGKEQSGGILGSLLAVDNINKIISTAGQFTQTQNGFDLIQPASNLAGRVIGGIIGGLVGSLAGGVGAIGGASVGASIGGGFGDVLGAFEQREAMTKENYFKVRNRYAAITGSNADGMEIPDMEKSGISTIQFLQMQGEYARRRGSSGSSGETTRDAIYAERALGVDQGTSALLIELQRSNKEDNRDLASLIGGIFERGQGGIFKNGDTTFLNEFIGKFSNLQKELLKSQTTVSTGLTMDILKQFNSMGGMFDARDPRSAGIINSINNSLANPDSDNMKALEFGILRRQMPNKGIFDIREEMSKGLGSPALLRGLMEQIDNMGGDDQAKMNNLSGALKGVPFSAIRTLFQNRKSLRNFDTSELKSIGLGEDVLKGKSEANTTDLEKNLAGIENGILGGQAVEKMADAFVVAIKAMLGGAVINLNNGQGTVTLLSQSSILQNSTKKPSSTKPTYYSPQSSTGGR